MHLEDEFGDIVRKAREGKGLSQKEVADSAGLQVEEIAGFEAYRSRPDRAQSNALAEVLALSKEALWQIAVGAYKPAVEGDLPGLEIETLTFTEMNSRCYLLHCRPTQATFLIDPGDSPEEILDLLAAKGWELTAILVTHGHSDHIGGLEGVLRSIDVPVYAHPNECRHSNVVPVTESGEIVIGETRVGVIYTPGHTPNGLTFLLGGAAAVGDTLFAGSLGRAHRGPMYYDRLLSSARRILSLPEETWLLPGHGPLTTVKAEKRFNPFVASASGSIKS